jgi:hypothetical protein
VHPACSCLEKTSCWYLRLCAHMLLAHAHNTKRQKGPVYRETLYTRGDFAHLSSYRMQHNKFVVSRRSPIRDAARRSSSTRRPAGGRNGPRRRVYRYSHAQESALAACVASRASLRFPERVDKEEEKRRNAFFSEIKRACAWRRNSLYCSLITFVGIKNV